MTVKELLAILKDVDPGLKVFSEVKSANKSVRGVQVVNQGAKRTKVVLK